MAPTTFIVGLSGPSSSGKTTLARLLRSIFNIEVTSTQHSGGSDESGGRRRPLPPLSLFILHEDDFYKTDAEIPERTMTSSNHGTRTLQDWDCVESLDLPLLQSTLSHVSRHGTLPPDMVSKEDQNSVGESGVDDSVVKELRAEVETWWRSASSSLSDPQNQGQEGLRICILDGFLLYPPPPEPSSSSTPVTTTTTTTSNPNTTTATTSPELLADLHSILSPPLLSLKLFLLSSRAQTIRRRSNRTGYVTLEGFWADPPGYVEDVVWPNYVRDHGWMFRGGVVDGRRHDEFEEGQQRRSGGDDDDGAGDGGDSGGNDEIGQIDEDAVQKEGIRIAPGRGKVGLSEVLRWAVEVVRDAVEEKMSK